MNYSTVSYNIVDFCDRCRVLKLDIYFLYKSFNLNIINYQLVYIKIMFHYEL